MNIVANIFSLVIVIYPLSFKIYNKSVLYLDFFKLSSNLVFNCNAPL